MATIRPKTSRQVSRAATKVKSLRNRTRACLICAEEDATFHTSPPSKRCAHDSTLCTECLFNHVRIKINSRELKIRCPEAGCSVVLKFNEVVSAARGDKVLIEKFNFLKTEQVLGADVTFVWCVNPRCEAGQYHLDGTAAPIVTCFQCGTKSCFQHQVAWHGGLTCSECDAMNRSVDRATTKFLKMNTKTCPGCHSRIQKDEGCDHMTCTTCQHEFCWICLADYQPILRYSNAYHKQNCQHYRVE